MASSSRMTSAEDAMKPAENPNLSPSDESTLLARLDRSSERYRRCLENFYNRVADVDLRALVIEVERAEFEFEVAQRAMRSYRMAASQAPAFAGRTSVPRFAPACTPRT